MLKPALRDRSGEREVFVVYASLVLPEPEKDKEKDKDKEKKAVERPNNPNIDLPEGLQIVIKELNKRYGYIYVEHVQR